MAQASPVSVAYTASMTMTTHASSPVAWLECNQDTVGALPYIQQLDPESPVRQLLGHQCKETSQIDCNRDEFCPLCRLEHVKGMQHPMHLRNAQANIKCTQ